MPGTDLVYCGMRAPRHAMPRADLAYGGVPEEGGAGGHRVAASPMSYASAMRCPVLTKDPFRGVRCGRCLTSWRETCCKLTGPPGKQTHEIAPHRLEVALVLSVIASSKSLPVHPKVNKNTHAHPQSRPRCFHPL
eukprot:1151235-Rhodomonas_salina.2